MRNKQGFTLLELLVSLVIVSTLIPMVAETSRSVCLSIVDLDNRAHTVRELGCVADALARDFGRARSVRAEDDSLELDLYQPLPSTGEDTVRYTKDRAGKLWRYHSGEASGTVVALGLVRFRTTQQDDDTVRVSITVRKGDFRRRLTVIGSTS